MKLKKMFLENQKLCFLIARFNLTAGCPAGWWERDYTCYYIQKSQQNFDVSAANCKIMGATLAEPLSLETDNGIYELVK